ncbi:MAG: hypothetical protein GXP37_06515 [Chloroflexi bacterium]|nr:hypothetical protein [Chloroflexota bacterium]
MMRAYTALGQRHLLARTYQRCVDTLRHELDLPPDAQTSHLYYLLVHGLAPEE